MERKDLITKVRQFFSIEELVCPHPIRMEANVVWLHIDVLEQYGIDEKVHLFNP